MANQKDQDQGEDLGIRESSNPTNEDHHRNSGSGTLKDGDTGGGANNGSKQGSVALDGGSSNAGGNAAGSEVGRDK